jgi:hypothetical protein
MKIVLALMAALLAGAAQAADEPRGFVLTDIENEPDDILAVTDDGSPALTRSRRVIVDVEP